MITGIAIAKIPCFFRILFDSEIKFSKCFTCCNDSRAKILSTDSFGKGRDVDVEFKRLIPSIEFSDSLILDDDCFN